MRVFLAGASGVIGRRLVPLLVADGHEVAGMTRTPGNAEMLCELGAEPVVVDVYDAEALRDAVVAFAPDLVMHQLTDLPDEVERIAEMGAANSRPVLGPRHLPRREPRRRPPDPDRRRGPPHGGAARRAERHRHDPRLDHALRVRKPSRSVDAGRKAP
jgi:hypothetical protein